MKIGILGGTFNPIHIGHLIMAEYIRESIPLDKVIFIPVGEPPHKKHTERSEDRFNMVKIAIESNPFFDISSIEMDRKGSSYTIDTIKQLDTIYPEDKLYFIIGADSLLDIMNWHKAEKLLQIVDFIVVGRNSLDKDHIVKNIENLTSKYGANIIFLETPSIEVSSTEIRKRVKEHKSIRYLVPNSVREYIIERNLYKE